MEKVKILIYLVQHSFLFYILLNFESITYPFYQMTIATTAHFNYVSKKKKHFHSCTYTYITNPGENFDKVTSLNLKASSKLETFWDNSFLNNNIN